MGKALGLTLALLLTLSLSAAAEQATGTIKMIDRTDNSIVLDDGTRLSVSYNHLMDVAPGNQVQAVYETQGGKKIVTELSTNLGTVDLGDMIDPNQASD